MGSKLGENRLPFHVDTSKSSASSLPVTASQVSARLGTLDRFPLYVSNPRQNASSVTPTEGQNRWSRLTASSSHTHCRSNSSNHSSSIGSAFLLVDPPTGKRQEKAGSPLSLNKIYRDSTYPSTILPPINTLPSLQISVNTSSPPLIEPIIASPLTDQILLETAFTVDCFDRPWDDFTLEPQDISHKKTRAVTIGPPSSLGPSGNKSDAVHLQGERPRSKDQPTKHRSQTNGSVTTPASGRSNKQNSQKAMLSKALQKANTAVLLDNAQNFKGAMQSYSEACALLQQVMYRSSGDEDRRKLEAIRDTYMNRVSELERIAPYAHDEDEALPTHPDEQSPKHQEKVLPAGNGTSGMATNYQSRLSEAREDRSKGCQYPGLPANTRTGAMNISLAAPMDSSYMPPPLSPRQAQSIANQPSPSCNDRRKRSTNLAASHDTKSSAVKGHSRAQSNESMSWLDTIDEPGGSTGSSVHSRTSSMGVRRKHIRASIGATEAEFDAALDAAVEAAYNDGLIPLDAPETATFEYEEEDRQGVDEDVVLANVRKRVELAKERVRQSEREHAIQAAHRRERRRVRKQQQQINANNTQAANESDEGEQLLENMTRSYMVDDFELSSHCNHALPGESDSSGFSGRTWNNSIGSNPTTSDTMFSTVSEKNGIPQLISLPPKTKPATQSTKVQPSLPSPQSTGLSSLSLASISQGVRSRRLSGQNAKQLKIETAKASTLAEQAASIAQPSDLKASDTVATSQTITSQQSQPHKSDNYQPEQPQLPHRNRQEFSPFLGTSPSESTTLLTPNFTQTLTNDNDSQPPRSGSPARSQSRGGPRKKFSSSSLKNLKGRNLSVSNAEDGGSDASINTPMSSQFSARDSNKGHPVIPALPTPIAMAFNDKQCNPHAGGMYLFNNDLLTPLTPSGPDSLGVGALEPCPTEYLLRPFWLMRALYQTIANPRGGFISNKLFVPRNVWEIKGVKIKYVDEKISNCDYLTAALLKLAQVDTFDADAVLDEMQLLESVLEQVQTVLTKKLGNDVGVQGSGGIFKDASIGGDIDNSNTSLKSSSTTTKSSFSWRRLRAKNSGAGLSNAYSNRTSEGPREGLAIATLPMTSNSIAKVLFAKREVSQIQCTGPNANYMGALVRLFDAAQIIDQIARQVEDPGLKHADKTQVGLELCTRHAAEFFGFYICRFVLTDVGLLLDKYIKKSTEWVLI